MNKTKLHEVIAVEKSLGQRALDAIAEVKARLKNKETLFLGLVKTLTMFNKNPENTAELEAIEAKEREEKLVGANIPNTMNYMAILLADYYNALGRKEEGACRAVSDIVVDGVVILSNVPVGFLLAMESRFSKLRAVLEEIPVLDSGKVWELDSAYGMEHIYKGALERKTRTAKIKEVTRFEASQPGPGFFQIVQSAKDVVVGSTTKQAWSGLIPASEKAQLLDRYDAILRAIKEARQRANHVDVFEEKYGDAMMKALFGDWFDRTKKFD